MAEQVKIRHLTHEGKDLLDIMVGDKGVTIAKPVDFNTLRLACDALHDQLAGISRAKLVMDAMAGLDA